MQESLLKEDKAKYSAEAQKMQNGDEIIFESPQGYDARLDHMINFFESVRTGKPTFEDASFGLRAAGPALLCNMSAEMKKAIDWDPQTMQVI